MRTKKSSLVSIFLLILRKIGKLVDAIFTSGKIPYDDISTILEWVDLLKFLVNPSLSLYLLSLQVPNKDDMFRVYLFEGSSVLYKKKSFLVQQRTIDSLYLFDNDTSNPISLNDKNLSVKKNMFTENYLLWLHSLKVNDIVDIYVKQKNPFWTCGVIKEIKTSGNDSFQVVVEYDQKEITLDKVTEDVLCFPFINSVGKKPISFDPTEKYELFKRHMPYSFVSTTTIKLNKGRFFLSPYSILYIYVIKKISDLQTWESLINFFQFVWGSFLV